jgi:hypothetical protein
MVCTKYLSKRNSGSRDRGTLPENVKKAHPYRMETVERMPLVFWALVRDVYRYIFAEGIAWATLGSLGIDLQSKYQKCATSDPRIHGAYASHLVTPLFALYKWSFPPKDQAPGV